MAAAIFTATKHIIIIESSVMNNLWYYLVLQTNYKNVVI